MACPLARQSLEDTARDWDRDILVHSHSHERSSEDYNENETDTIPEQCLQNASSFHQIAEIRIPAVQLLAVAKRKQFPRKKTAADKSAAVSILR